MALAAGLIEKDVPTSIPPFIQAINDSYLGTESHVFCLTGNIDDFVGNDGRTLGIQKVLAGYYDDNILEELGGTKTKFKESGVQENGKTAPVMKVAAFYNTSSGLEFLSEKSLEAWIKAHEVVFGKKEVEEWDSTPGSREWAHPRSPETAMAVINRWFMVAKELSKRNQAAKMKGDPLSLELALTLVFTDADALFPAGDIANLTTDRTAIVYMRNWAREEKIGHRNRIILMTRHVSDIHESIRSELAVGHTVAKPNLQDRREWIGNYDKNIQHLVARMGKPYTVGSNTNVTRLVYADDFSEDEFAIQSAGMSRRQIRDVVLASFRTGTGIDFSIVQERKRRALENEYGGMIDIKEPKFGFDQIGGHESFKDYCRWHIIKPLKEGTKRLCSRGALLTGPPGTGKSMIAWALAKEAGLNFIQVDLGKVFGGLVGETEKNVRKLLEAIEAASPCIVFIDEIDSVLSSGRSSAGDSGTSARVFNNVMSWLSDPTRVGKVVVVAATNRPDLLDSALIRMGRMDAIIPMLAPARGDALGRWNILAALTKKHKLVLHPDLVKTRDDEKSGLGKLLHDKERIWTGAEMEAVLQASLQKAYRANRMAGSKPDLRVCVDDFNGALDAIVPRTAEVELQTDLALYFANNLDYVPEDWREIARDKKALKQSLADRLGAETVNRLAA